MEFSIKYPASSVAPLSLLVPIFGLLGSFLIFQESIGLTKIFACIFIVFGLIINTFGNKLLVLKKKVNK
jgi:O-acetylserine/cysteine efflux transporter